MSPSHLKPCAAAEVRSIVEERRFSAASSLKNDVGFSPRGCIFCLGMLAAVVLFALSVALPFSASAQKSAGANVTADLPAGPMQAKATTACLECHEARIILQQRLSKAAWTKEVDKMTKWGAVVDPSDRDALIDYLSTNFGPDKPAYEPPRTSGWKKQLRKFAEIETFVSFRKTHEMRVIPWKSGPQRRVNHRPRRRASAPAIAFCDGKKQSATDPMSRGSQTLRQRRYH